MGCDTKFRKITAPKGVYAAVATPVTSALEPDIDRFLDHCRWLLDNGCTGLAPLGTTGEANSFGLTERLSLIEAMATAGLSMDRMIVGTGMTSVSDTVLLSKTALEAGAVSLLMIPPFYYKNPTEDGLFAYFAGIAERLGSRNPQIFLYHFPQMSAVPVTVSLIGRLRESYPGIFVGIKDSSGDIDSTTAFLEAFPGFAAFSGTEIHAARTLELGGWGCISATANVTAPIVASRIAALESDDHAELDERIRCLRTLISSHHNIGGSKAVLSEFRQDTEWARVVPPNVALDQDSAARLAEQIDGTGNLRKYFRR